MYIMQSVNPPVMQSYTVSIDTYDIVMQYLYKKMLQQPLYVQISSQPLSDFSSDASQYLWLRKWITTDEVWSTYREDTTLDTLLSHGQTI